MKTIVAATDLGARSDRAVLRAAYLARQSGARLCILHVIDDDLPGAILQSRSEEAERVLAQMVADNALLTEVAPDIKVETGHIDRLLPEVLREVGADLLVVGGHRSRGLGDFLGKPTLSRLLRGITVPVIMALARPEHAYAKVSVGWDFSPAGAAAARLAQTVAPDAQITLVHAWQEVATGAPYAFETGGSIPPEALARVQSDVARAAADLSQDGRTVSAAKVDIGSAGHILRRRAEAGDADLIAMGQHARTGLARLLLGATAEDVALNAPCDVLIAPPG